jgi:hypothetical protein
MKINEITSIARPLDLNYLTNKAIALLSGIVFIAITFFWIIVGREFLDSAWWGFIASLAVFLSWAIARELDPDYDLSAFVTTGLSLIGIIVFGLPKISMLFWILLVARMVNRTTGLPVKRLDSLFLLVLAGWLTINENILIGLMTALAFLLDSFLSKPQKHQILFASIQLLIVGISSSFNDVIFGEGTLSPSFALAIVVISSLFLVVIADSRKVRAVGDQTAELLDPRRVQAAQILALSTALLMAVWNGLPGIRVIMLLWAAIIGTSVYRFFVLAKTSLLFISDDKKE